MMECSLYKVNRENANMREVNALKEEIKFEKFGE